MEQIPTNITEWFINTGALATVIATIIAFIKTNIIKTNGIITLALTFTLGAALGYTGYALNIIEGTWLTGIGFGLAAALIAAGGWDAITTLGKKRAENHDTTTDRTRTKLR